MSSREDRVKHRMPMERLQQSPEEEEAFEAQIAPAREALAALLDASDQLRDQWGSFPDADSPAMAELAAQTAFRGNSPWDEEPAQAARGVFYGQPP